MVNLDYTPTPNWETLSTGTTDIETLTGQPNVKSLGILVEDVTWGAITVTYASWNTMSITKVSSYWFWWQSQWAVKTTGMTIDVPASSLVNVTWEV